MDPEHDAHDLRRLTRLGDTHALVSHETIISSEGVRLVEKGQPVTRAMFDKLVASKLLRPLAECLTADDALDGRALGKAVDALLPRDPNFGALIPDQARRNALARALGALRLPPQLALELTLVREGRSELFTHSLHVAIVAYALAQHAATNAIDPAAAALAGLVHDLGMLHLAPETLTPGPGANPQHHGHRYTHPVVGHLLLSAIPGIPGEVSQAVLEHHERLDGSGYPRGLRGKRLTPLGRLLAVAEVGATVLRDSGGLPARERLSAILRFNHDKLDEAHTAALQRMVCGDEPPPGSGAESATILEALVRLCRALQHWRTVRMRSEERGGTERAVELLDRRVQRLEHDLADAGIDLEFWTTIDADFGSAGAGTSELLICAQEGLWQLRAMADEAGRRWPKWRWRHEQTRKDVHAWLEQLDRIGD